jgi:hypothetical protein
LLKRIFGHKTENIVAKLRKFSKLGPSWFVLSPNIIRVIKWRRMRWVRHVARIWKNKKRMNNFIWEAGPLEICSYCWEDNIKIDLRQIGCNGVDRIPLSQDINKWWGFVSTVMNVRVP